MLTGFFQDSDFIVVLQTGFGSGFLPLGSGLESDSKKLESEHVWPRLHQKSQGWDSRLEIRNRDSRLQNFTFKLIFFKFLSFLWPVLVVSYLQIQHTKLLNHINFTIPFLCNIQSLETRSLRDRDEAWNLRDRDSSRDRDQVLRLHHWSVRVGYAQIQLNNTVQPAVARYFYKKNTSSNKNLEMTQKIKRRRWFVIEIARTSPISTGGFGGLNSPVDTRRIPPNVFVSLQILQCSEQFLLKYIIKTKILPS